MMPKKFDIATFHENLEALRRLSGHNKGNFNKMLGLANAFRKKINSVGDRLWLGITNNFNVPGKEWLLTKHSEEEMSLIKFTPRQKSSVPYEIVISSRIMVEEPHRPRLSAEQIESLCKKVRNILESQHPTAIPALISNITAFEDSVKQIERIDNLEKEVKRLSANPVGTAVAGGGLENETT